jgi:hypothetical protein
LKTIYTAIFGNYDELKEPFHVSQKWKYVCYTDQDFTSDVWEVRKVQVMSCGPAKTARWYKINFHEHIETEFSMWVDATFFINIDLNRWWRRFTSPFTVIDHPFDDCLYTDIKSCMKGDKGDFFTLAQQAIDYRDLGIPENNGLISSGILMRENTLVVREFCKLWWSQVEKYTERDQVAFGYAAFHQPIFHRIEWDYTQREEFIHCPHIHKAWREERKNQILKKHSR